MEKLGIIYTLNLNRIIMSKSVIINDPMFPDVNDYFDDEEQDESLPSKRPPQPHVDEDDLELITRPSIAAMDNRSVLRSASPRRVYFNDEYRTTNTVQSKSPPTSQSRSLSPRNYCTSSSAEQSTSSSFQPRWTARNDDERWRPYYETRNEIEDRRTQRWNSRPDNDDGRDYGRPATTWRTNQPEVRRWRSPSESRVNFPNSTDRRPAPANNNGNCRNCGRIHAPNRQACPANGLVCFFCNKPGHFARLCRSARAPAPDNYRGSH